MTATGRTDEFQVEQWTYIGKRRQSRNNALYYAFLDPSGEELWYSKVQHVTVIGGVYNVEVSRAEGRTTIRRNPDWTGDYAPDLPVLGVSSEAQRELWALEDRRAKQDVERIRVGRKASERDQLQQAIDPLREIAQRCRTRAQREALIATVIAELGGVW